MKQLLIITILFFTSLQTLELSKIRVSYKEAAQSQEKVNAFYENLTSVSKADNPALIAYKGASIALKAKHGKTLKAKKEGFVEGVGYIEYAIEKDSNDIEARFVRLGIQENTPRILKYKDAIEADKAFILNQFPYISSDDLKNHISNYILQSDVFTTEEKSVISSH